MRMLAIVIGVLASFVHAETLVLFGSDDYAPISTLAEGKPQGIFPELLARIEKEAGDHYDLRLVPWRRAQLQARRGEGGISNFTWSSERAAAFDYSVPLYNREVVLVVLKGKEFPFGGLSDLKGKKVGVGPSATYGGDVDKAIEQGLFAIDVDSSQGSRMRKLLAGRVDAIFVSSGRQGVAHMLASHADLKDVADRIVVLPTPLISNSLHVAFPKNMNKTEALERLNKAYLKLQKAGSLKDILGPT